jgi:hypothetical protein
MERAAKGTMNSVPNPRRQGHRFSWDRVRSGSRLTIVSLASARSSSVDLQSRNFRSESLIHAHAKVIADAAGNESHMSTNWKVRFCAAAVLASVAPDTSHAGEYCMSYNCGTYCGFTSIATCNASASGIGGACSAAPPDNTSPRATSRQRALPQDSLAEVPPGTRITAGRQPRIPIRHHRRPAM